MDIHKQLSDVSGRFAGGAATGCAGQTYKAVQAKVHQSRSTCQSAFSFASNNIGRHGYRGIYTGAVPVRLYDCTEKATVFGLYDQKQTDLEVQRRNVAAGTVGSLFTSSVMGPIELLKISMQNLNNNHTKEKYQVSTILDIIIGNTWKADNRKCMFRGMECTVARENLGCTTFSSVYQWAREQLNLLEGSKEDCGLFTWFLASPFGVVKYRMQKSRKSIGFQFVEDEIRNAGLQGLYWSFLPAITKKVHTTEKSQLCNNKKLPILSFCNSMAWWIAGIVSTCIGHPIDTIKIVQQVTNTSIMNAVRQVYAKDKFSGYFRGLMFPVFTMGIINTMYYAIYNNMMKYLYKFRSNETNDDMNVRFCSDSKKLHKYWHLDVFTSGCVAGLITTLIDTPFKIIKIILQTSNIPSSAAKTEKINSLKLITLLYKTNGIISLYRGGSLILARDVLRAGLFMLICEHSCSILKNRLTVETKQETMPKHINILGVIIAGIVSWISILPLDVIKSKIVADHQMKRLYYGTWDCIKKMYAEGGVKYFYRGFWLLCIRPFLVNGTMFLICEILLDICAKNTKNTNILLMQP